MIQMQCHALLLCQMLFSHSQFDPFISIFVSI